MYNKNELNQLYRYALSLCNNEELAYDLVHSCIEKIINKSLIINKQAYAKKVIRNNFFDIIKSKSFNSIELLEQNNTEGESPQHLDDRILVKELLARLQPHERELLYLIYVEGYTTAEIAKLTSTPRGTITSRLMRLKDSIQQNDGGYNG